MEKVPLPLSSQSVSIQEITTDEKALFHQNSSKSQEEEEQISDDYPSYLNLRRNPTFKRKEREDILKVELKKVRLTAEAIRDGENVITLNMRPLRKYPIETK